MKKRILNTICILSIIILLSSCSLAKVNESNELYSNNISTSMDNEDKLVEEDKNEKQNEIINQENDKKIIQKDDLIRNSEEQDKSLKLNESKETEKKEERTSESELNKSEKTLLEENEEEGSNSLLNSSEIQEGVYAIKTALNENYVLDVSGAAMSNSANIQIWNDAYERQQRFYIKKAEDNCYIITAEHSGKSIDVKNAEKINGTNLQQFQFNNSDAQKWIIRYDNDGYYSIMSKCNGLYVDVTNAQAKNGANVHLFEGNGTKAQKFKLDRMDLPKQSKLDLKEGRYIIETGVNEKKVLDVSGGSTYNNANIQIWDNANVTQQRFDIKYENGFYSIKSEKTGKSLDALNIGIKNSTNIQQYDYVGNLAQQWIISDAGNGYYNIISKYSGLYLDINGGENRNGANVQLYQGNGTKAQKFKLKKVGLDNEDRIDLDEGKYIIKSTLNTNKVLDVSGLSKENGGNIQLWDRCHGFQQQFEIKYENNSYSIKNINSSKSLDIENSGISNGSNVQQNDYKGLETQKWILIKNDDETYSIVSQYNGLYLDVNNASTSNGANIHLWEGNGTKAQKFLLEKVEEFSGEQSITDGTYQIKSSLKDKYVLDVSGGSTWNNANIQIWENADVLQQNFNIRYIGDGYYSIVAVHSGKALDVECYGNCNGTNVQQYEYSNNDAQKWIIRDEGNNQYSIISKTSNLFLTVEGEVTGNGKNVYTWERKDNNSQRFILTKTETKSERTIMDGNFEIATNKTTNYVMDVTGGSNDDYANIQFWERNTTPAQKFFVQYIDGYYIIESINSNKVLTIDNNNNVVQRPYENTIEQRWIIKSDLNGNYNIISMYNDKYLETDDILYSGANVQVGDKNASRSQSFKFLTRKITVVVNPGHGGKDSGCSSWSGLLEKNITLRIAQFLRDDLRQSSNYNVILTHEGLEGWDEMSLSDRAQIARDNNADVYVSLHINAEPRNSASGSMVFVPYYEGERHYNSSMSWLGWLIQDWLESIGIRKYTNNAITKRCETESPRYQYMENGAIVQADYYADIRHAMKGGTLGYGPDLNNETGIPAILVEHCFINTDTAFVANDDAIRRIANADASAIREYFGVY